MKLVLVMCEQADKVWRQQFGGLVAALRSCGGFRVQTVSLPPDAYGDVPRLIDFWKPAAVVYARPRPHPKGAFGNLPVVYFDNDAAVVPKGAYHVRHDSRATVTAAAKELFAAETAFCAAVGDPRRMSWSLERLGAFVEMAHLNGYGDCPIFDPSTVAPFSSAWSRKLTAWVAKLPLPCAVFAATDKVGAEVLSCSARLGIHVPEDLSLVSVDNDEYVCESTDPEMTSVEPDWNLSGRLCAELLVELMHGGCEDRIRTFGPIGVFVRGSSRHARSISDYKVSQALKYIRAHACEGLKAQEVVAIFGGSRRSAETRFREVVGHSILQEIRRCRYQRAAMLLRSGLHTKLAVANMCGWKSDRALWKMNVDNKEE